MSISTAEGRNWAAKQSAETRRGLILSAMRLMAEKGIEGVSLRAVNAAAGAKNASAAHYHFGSKLGLVEAIVDLLGDDVARVRAPIVAELRERAKSETLSPREIIEGTYGPFMGLMFHAEYGLAGIRFLARLIVDTGPETRVLANRFTEPLVHEVFSLMVDALPEMPERVLKMRILFSLINLINGMSDVMALETSPFGDMSTPGSLEAANHFLEYIAAGISAPPSEMREGFLKQSREIIQTYREWGTVQGTDS